MLDYKNMYKLYYQSTDRKELALKEMAEDRSVRELCAQIWAGLREINKGLSNTGTSTLREPLPPPDLKGQGERAELLL